MICSWSHELLVTGGNPFGVRATKKVADIIAGFPEQIKSSAMLKNVAGVGKASITKVIASDGIICTCT